MVVPFGYAQGTLTGYAQRAAILIFQSRKG
jgi:hypothetical protein